MKINEIINESEQLDELSWQDIKQGATNFGQNIKQGVGNLGQNIKQGASNFGQHIKQGAAQAKQGLDQVAGQATDAAGNFLRQVPGATRRAAAGVNQAYQTAKNSKAGQAAGAVAGGVVGAVKGAYAQNRARAAGGANLDIELDQWKKFKQQRGTLGTNVQDDIQQWVHSRYPSATQNGKDAVDVANYKLTIPSEQARYITDMYSAAMSNRQLHTTQQGQGQSTSVPGVEIVTTDPITIKFRNTDYQVNDQGEWAPVKNPNQKLSQAMNTFLDKIEASTLPSE